MKSQTRPRFRCLLSVSDILLCVSFIQCGVKQQWREDAVRKGQTHSNGEVFGLLVAAVSYQAKDSQRGFGIFCFSMGSFLLESVVL